MKEIANKEVAEEVLTALGEQLAALGSRFEIVVIGGSGLLALGLVERSTRDVDIVALRADDADADLQGPDPLPKALQVARDRVARDFSLPQDWLNPGPSSLLDFDLPQGFVDRLQARSYGDYLTVQYASRLDQIHFKFYAAVDEGAGKHLRDLEALFPSPEELLKAARWACSHDPSPEFEGELRLALAHFGVDDGDPWS